MSKKGISERLQQKGFVQKNNQKKIKIPNNIIEIK